MLAGGTVLIDTPGVGSTLQHNTDAAFQVLPECDAGLFIVSADPPITEIEIEYLRRLKSKTPRIFYVLNKMDYLQPDEQGTVTRFLQKVFSEKSLFDSESPIFCVSARDGLSAKQAGDCRMLELSGMSTLEDQLVGRLATEKTRWLEDALRTKAMDILAEASGGIALRLRVLNMPLEELTSKSQTFQDALGSLEEQRRITRDLLAGDHKRLRASLELYIHGLRKEASSKLKNVIDSSFDSFAGMTVTVWEQTGRDAVSALMAEIFEAACARLMSAFSSDASAILSVQQRRIDALIDHVRRPAVEIFDVSFGPDTQHETFQRVQEPYWVTESAASALIPDSNWLINRLLPAAFRWVRLRARVVRQTDELILRNAENSSPGNSPRPRRDIPKRSCTLRAQAGRCHRSDEGCDRGLLSCGGAIDPSSSNRSLFASIARWFR